MDNPNPLKILSGKRIVTDGMTDGIEERRITQNPVQPPFFKVGLSRGLFSCLSSKNIISQSNFYTSPPYSQTFMIHTNLVIEVLTLKSTTTILNLEYFEFNIVTEILISFKSEW